TDARSTACACVRLRVEAPVGGIIELAPALSAHREVRHRCGFPIVRNVLHDGEARAAICAINERITIASVVWIEKLGHTLVANSHVGRHQRPTLVLAAALRDAEARFSYRRDDAVDDAVDRRQRRRMLAQIGEKIVEVCALAFQLDDNAAPVVDDRPGETVLRRESVDEWTKTHPLNHALDENLPPLFHSGVDSSAYSIDSSISSFPCTMFISAAPQRGHNVADSSNVASVWQEAQTARTAVTIRSTAAFAASVSLPAQEKPCRKDSLSTRRMAPMRTRTRATRRPAARRHTASTIASHKPNSCMLINRRERQPPRPSTRES